MTNRYHIAEELKGLLMLVILTILLYASAYAQEKSDYNLAIYFRQGISAFDPKFRDNGKRLEDCLDQLLRGLSSDSLVRQTINVQIVGGASPEGSVKLNEGLSHRRANHIYRYVKDLFPDMEVEFNFQFLGRDWGGLLEMVDQDSLTPRREEVIGLLNDIKEAVAEGETEKQDNLNRIKRLRSGIPYRYMYAKHFPELRKATLFVSLSNNSLFPEPIQNTNESYIKLPDIDISPYLPPIFPDILIPQFLASRAFIIPNKPPFYMDIRTNLIFDAIAIPNLGVEFYLGKNWSIVGDWQYAWWKSDSKNFYWRFYGGDVAVRKWFGGKAHGKPLTGHHIGAYGQIYTYDFDLGKDGELGGKPGGNLWDRHHWGAGVEYGYSLPVGKRINIDFSLGVGYTTGYYYVYKPIDDHYVWQHSGIRHWFGPTKAEISLAWLVGRGNYNELKKKKGGGE